MSIKNWEMIQSYGLPMHLHGKHVGVRHDIACALLQLKYFSDIPWTSGRTPDVQLRAIDATLCIIGYLAPNLGKCPDVFLLLQVKYFSDILRTSGQTPDVRLCTMATAFLHYRTTSAQLG